MGSWYETCSITNLPIKDGEPIRYWVIGRKPDDGFGCYPDDYWTPLMLPLKGVYGDYGRIDDVVQGPSEEVARAFIMSLLSAEGKAVFQPAQTSAFGEAAAPEVNFWHHAPYSLIDSREKEAKSANPKANYHQVMVHEFAFQEMVGFKQKPAGEDGITELGTSLLAEFDKLVDAMKDPEFQKDLLRQWAFQNSLRSFYTAGYGGGYLSSFNTRAPFEKYIDKLQEFAAAGDFGQDFELLKQDLLDFRWYWWAMRSLRREWSPRSCPSQGEEYEFHNALLKASKKHVARELRRQKSWSK